MEGDSRRLLVVPEQRPEADAIVPAAIDECQVPFTTDSLHDLASPINQVGTMSGLFIDRYRNRLDEDADALLGHMERSTRHLHRLMAGLARYVATVIHGMAVQAASGTTRAELRRVAEAALRAWPR